ncbi:hypothetical protein QCA50_013067 [Cerrena zonata]|uniref:Uncharacterized protein n=1 Tax=Cerrena zonata TaxID=2478898 RepID=A0AAW0FSC9_9APHY
MSQDQKPSNILHRISSQSPTSVFINALERNLYPLLDELSLDARSRIIRVLELVEWEAGADTALLIDVVNYDIHEKSLNDQVKALEKHCKRNWHRSSEIQAEMMMKIGKEVLQWLPHLWQIGVEKGLEMDLVQKCLVLCTTIIIRVTKCGSFVEFCEIEFALVISDTIGNVVYKDNTYLLQSIAWVWRELLVSATSKHRSPNGILADIRRLQFEEEVYEYLKRGNVENRMDEGRGYWDVHWNEDMRAAALFLLDERHQDRIRNFDKRISLTLYKEILSEDPTIKDRLLRITRRQMFEDKDRLVATNYRTAVQIFGLDSSEDLPALLDVLPGDMDTLEVKKIIFRFWADSNLPTSCAKALELLKSGLEEAKKRVLDEVNNAFPNF